MTNESTEIENCYSSLSRELHWLWNSVYIAAISLHAKTTRSCFNTGKTDQIDDDDDSTVLSIMSGLETRSLGLNTLGST